MTMLRGMLRAEVLTGLPPDRILHDLNQLAINDLDQSHRFVTLFYSDYDPRTKKLNTPMQLTIRHYFGKTLNKKF